MAEQILTRNLTINLPPEEVFEFFSNARNLEEITPPELNFRIKTKQPIEMKKGTLINYMLKLRGFPISWQTVISEWNPPFSFTDMALKSPYKKWIHRHTFTENSNGGTNIKDEVQYLLPYGSLGRLMHWYVRKELNYIFDFRQKTISETLQEVKIPFQGIESLREIAERG